MSPDVVDLLLPEADEERRAHARRVATCLRLLANDASPRRASRVGLALESARNELARDRRGRLLEALRELLVAHLAAVRSADAFLTLEPPDGDVHSAWSALEEERAALPWLAGVPAPGESPLEVAGRLLVCARRLGLDLALELDHRQRRPVPVAEFDAEQSHVGLPLIDPKDRPGADTVAGAEVGQVASPADGDLGGALNQLRLARGLPAMPLDALRPYASAGARGSLSSSADSPASGTARTV